MALQIFLSIENLSHTPNRACVQNEQQTIAKRYHTMMVDLALQPGFSSKIHQGLKINFNDISKMFKQTRNFGNIWERSVFRAALSFVPSKWSPFISTSLTANVVVLIVVSNGKRNRGTFLNSN